MKSTTREFLAENPEFDKIIDDFVELAREVKEKRKFGRTGLMFHHKDGLLTTKPVDEIREWQKQPK